MKVTFRVIRKIESFCNFRRRIRNPPPYVAENLSTRHSLKLVELLSVFPFLPHRGPGEKKNECVKSMATGRVPPLPSRQTQRRDFRFERKNLISTAIRRPGAGLFQHLSSGKRMQIHAPSNWLPVHSTTVVSYLRTNSFLHTSTPR